MPREAKVFWDRNAGAWRSDVGAMNEKGRRKPVYFREARAADGSVRSLGRSDRLLADDALRAYLRARERAERGPVVPTACELVELYLAHAERALEPRTVAGHVDMLSAWIDFVPRKGAAVQGESPANELGAEDLDRMLAAWEARGAGAHYRARLYRSVRACWRWASKVVPDREPRRLIPADTMEGARAPVIPEAPERYAERKEIADFLRFAWRRANAGPPGSIRRTFDRQAARLVQLCALAGCRPGEARQVTWAMIDWDRRQIVLAKHKTSGKTGARRIFGLETCPLLVRALRRMEAREGRHPDFVFCHKRGRGGLDRSTREAGEPWETRELCHKIRMLRKEAIAAGLKLADQGPDRFVLYRLRHTSITRDLEGGLSEAETAKRHGTSARMVQQTYNHLQIAKLDTKAREAQLRARALRRGDRD